MISSTASKLGEVIGPESAKRVVERLSSEDRGTHAVLFYGVAGSGKEELARVLAQTWLCKSPVPGSGADGECQPCKAFERGTNPDFLHIVPTGLSNLILAKQIVNRSPEPDDPVAMLTLFRTSPLMSRHKVALVSDAHRMNEIASNALLKTLEEPWPHAKIILTTDSIGGVKPTILSRCLTVSCALPTREQMKAMFHGASEDLVRLAQGSPGRLRGVLSAEAEHDALIVFARRLRDRAAGEALVASEEFRAIAERLEATKKVGARAANAEALALLATYLSQEAWARPEWVQLVVEAHRRVLGNANATITFDALFAGILSAQAV